MCPTVENRMETVFLETGHDDPIVFVLFSNKYYGTLYNMLDVLRNEQEGVPDNECDFDVEDLCPETVGLCLCMSMTYPGEEPSPPA